MQLRKLLIAAVILAALSGAVWYTKQHPPSACIEQQGQRVERDEPEHRDDRYRR